MNKLRWIFMLTFALSFLSGVSAKNPKCPKGQGWDGVNRVCGCMNGLLKDQGGLACLTKCPVGQAPSGPDRLCKFEKCPAGYVQKGTQCIKDTVAAPPASTGMVGEGGECGNVLVNGKWQSGVRCPSGMTCENPSGRTGICKKSAPPVPAGVNRTETRENQMCGKVKAANGAIDNVTCANGMTCAPSTNATYAAQGLGSCKKPAAAPAKPAAAGGTEGVGARCGTWYSGGDVTRACKAGLSCRYNGQEIQVSPQVNKSGTCNRPCTDANGANGCFSGWSAQ